MRKFFFVLLIALSIFALVACKDEPEHEHTRDDGKITANPTCIAEGEKTYTCTGCGETKTEAISKTAHTLTFVAKVDETCDANGQKAHYHCSVCNKDFEDDKGTVEATSLLIAKHHTFSETWVYDSTHHWHEATCEHTSEIGNYENHTYVSEVTTPATCITTGLTTWTCDVCGRSFQTLIDKINPSGHTWEVTSSDGEGHTSYECTTCHLTKTEYAIGSTGPAGGIVFYDCDADNTELDPDGKDNLRSDIAGWRYLEVAASDLRVVNGEPTIDPTAEGYDSADEKYIFGYYRKTDDGDNLYVCGETTLSDTVSTTWKMNYGNANTLLLIGVMGEEAYSSATGSEKTPYYAAKLCYDLVSTYGEETFDDWFLASSSENGEWCQLLFGNGTLSLPGNKAQYFWNSHESAATSGAAYRVYWNGDLAYTSEGHKKSDLYRIRPIRSFL